MILFLFKDCFDSGLKIFDNLYEHYSDLEVIDLFC